MIRTFHPVGQGAFYTEQHLLENGSVFTVVFDCGSGKRISNNMQTRISNSFRIETVIAVLFISHILSLHIPLYHIDDDIKSIVVQSN
jgi:hypothetical protein